MLTDRQKRICERFRQEGPDGKVGCSRCPLLVNKDALMCRANSSYDRHEREWVPD